jgi:hypothetical protein
MIKLPEHITPASYQGKIQLKVELQKSYRIRWSISTQPPPCFKHISLKVVV